MPAPKTWIAIIDDQGAVAAITPDGEQRATFSRPGDAEQGISASIPAWSHDGTSLAWTETDRSEGPALVTSRLDRRVATRDPLPLAPFYVSWNPIDTHVAVLGGSGRGTGVGVAVSELADRNTEPVEIDAAASYYLSWAADGERFLAHRGNDDLVVMDLAGRAAPLMSSPGSTQAPIWLEDGRIVGVEAIDRNRVVVLDARGREVGTVLDTDLNVSIIFTADPTGRWLAAQAIPNGPLVDPTTDAVIGADGPEAAGEVLIIDLSSGQVAWRTGLGGPAWFWSPDGQSLLALTPEAPTGSTDRPLVFGTVVWHLPVTGSVDNPAQTLGPRFQPSERFLSDWLPFFDQYDQGATPWAPDSSGWTFAGVPVGADDQNRDAVAGIYVVGAGPGSDAVFVTEGEVSVWAPTAGGGGGSAPSPA